MLKREIENLKYNKKEIIDVRFIFKQVDRKNM